MTGLGLFLLAIGVGDIVSGGLAGTPRTGRLSLVGCVASIATSGVAGYALALPVLSVVSLMVLSAFTAGTWTWARIRLDACRGDADGQSGSRRSRIAALAAGSLGSGVGVAFLAWSWWPDPAPGRLEPLLRGFVEDGHYAFATPERFVLIVGTAVALIATSNAVVRVVLDAAGTRLPQGDGVRLDGGRYIGVLERWLIYGLALSGEPTAAALVVSAKSILRFPEVSRSVANNGGATDVTEYFVLGSLASWTLALAAAALV